MAKEPIIEDLKCCGNCSKGMVISKNDESYFCASSDEPVEPREWCCNWNFDGYEKEERNNDMFTPEMLAAIVFRNEGLEG